MPKIKISGLDLAGDSLSDRGGFAARNFGPFDAACLAGISSTSPKERFSNGFVWSDYLAIRIAGHAAFSDPERRRDESASAAAADFSDDVITHRAGEGRYDLDNANIVAIRDQAIVRTYTEGGVTADDWRHTFEFDQLGARYVLSTLKEKTSQQFENDGENDFSKAEKSTRLQLIWAGANDLISVNDVPTAVEAAIAVDAVKQNIRLRYAQGYRNFRVMNLPDLSKAPRYSLSGEKKEQHQKAREASKAYNKYLAGAVEELQTEYNDINIGIIDVASKYDDIYANPESYDLDRKKLNIPFIQSDDFSVRRTAGGQAFSHADGYASWDGVHPTAQVHAYLGDFVVEQLSQDFDLDIQSMRLQSTLSKVSKHGDRSLLQRLYQQIDANTDHLDTTQTQATHSQLYDRLHAISDKHGAVVQFADALNAGLVKAFNAQYSEKKQEEKTHYFTRFFRRYKAPASQNMTDYIAHAKQRGAKSRTAVILKQMGLIDDGLNLKDCFSPDQFRQQKTLESVLVMLKGDNAHQDTEDAIINAFISALPESAQLHMRTSL